MIPGPVSKVIATVGRLTGEPDRVRSLATINGILQFLYRDENLLWLYFKAQGCRPVDSFEEQCRNCVNTWNPKTFHGVVMPAGVHNIRELRRDGFDIEITEERVERNCNQWEFRPRAEHMPPRLLEKDPCGSRLVYFQSDCQEDCGKLIGVEYLDMNATPQREDVVLGTAPSGMSLSVGAFMNITFPERRGYIKVTTAEGQELGHYHPSILVPTHEWFRLSTACNGQLINYRGLKEPHELVNDTDMVPFSDEPLWKLALKAYQFMDAMDLTPGQTNALARIFAQLASVNVADLKADNMNFNLTLFPETSRSALATGRRFSSGRYRSRMSDYPAYRSW